MSDDATERHHWFEPVADHLGEAYLRYSFTKGTVQEVDHVVDALALVPGDRVLDVGCGPGRHAHELGRRGIRVVGIDISARFIELARRDAPPCTSFHHLDARNLASLIVPGPGSGSVFGSAEFDAVICLCQGAFGLMTANGDDEAVIAGISHVLRPGGRLALSAFNAYFSVKYHEASSFDAANGVSHERTAVRNDRGEPREVDLWTGCYTPRELRMLLRAHGLRVDRISSVEPGAYGDGEPTTESPEFLVIATRC